MPDEKDEELQFLTSKEIAEMLKIHVRTVQLWVSSGELSATWIGKREYRISKKDLREFLARRREANPQQEEPS